MLHLTTSLCNETCLLLFPWIFKDEEGKRRDKRMSPPYVELIEEVLPENYTIEQEIRKRMNDDLLHQILDEVIVIFLFFLLYYSIFYIFFILIIYTFSRILHHAVDI